MKKLFLLSRFQIVLLISLCCSNTAMAQTAFFKSNLDFSKNELSNFYTSFTIDSTQVYFNANDYNIYAYNKTTGLLNWSYFLNTKSNITPKLNDSNVFVGKHIDENDNKCVQLNAKTGILLQTLLIERLETRPLFKKDIMYCTAIESGGNIMAYDLKNNSILWKKFIAHGVSKQPYFFNDKIIANAEADNWFSIDYRGSLLDTFCKNKANIFVEDIKCVQNFRFLTHDNQEISSLFIEKYFGDNVDVKVKLSKNKTFILGDEKLIILGKNKKLNATINIAEIAELVENGYNDLIEILAVSENSISFFHKNQFVIYDFEKKKTLRIINLAKWNPHQIILDKNSLWLISKTDGQLYGVKID